VPLIYPNGLGDGSFTSGNTNGGWQPHNFIYGSPIVIASSGTVTQFGVIGNRGGRGTNVLVKFGLYTSAGVLVGQSSAIMTATSNAWLDSGAVSLSVTAQTYYLMVSGDYEATAWAYSNTFNGTFATESYASAMAATESLTIGGETGIGFGVRVDFTESGGIPNSSPLFPTFPMALMRL
jgi:hypothetical protein